MHPVHYISFLFPPRVVVYTSLHQFRTLDRERLVNAGAPTPRTQDICVDRIFRGREIDLGNS